MKLTLLKMLLMGLAVTFLTSCAHHKIYVDAIPPHNTLSADEQAEGWRLLWDGQTAAGWRSPKGDFFPTTNWTMQDGELSVIGSGNPEAQSGGDIITVDTYSNFDLTVDFKITPVCNSGIKIFVQPNLNSRTGINGPPGTGSCLGLEYQVLDDDRHPDAKLGHDGNRREAALYDILPATAPTHAKPVGEWNTARIVSRGHRVEHWLNGEKILEYDRGSAEFRAGIARSKFSKIPNFGEWAEGHILLQEHGSAVSFRNIKLRVL